MCKAVWYKYTCEPSTFPWCSAHRMLCGAGNDYVKVYRLRFWQLVSCYYMFVYLSHLYRRQLHLLSEHADIHQQTITEQLFGSYRYVCKKPRDPWCGVWWIVLFMYTHVVHTSISILNCPILPGRSGDLVPVSA